MYSVEEEKAEVESRATVDDSFSAEHLPAFNREQEFGLNPENGIAE